MASPSPYTKRPSPPPSLVQPRSKSTTTGTTGVGGGGFFCKSVLFALFLFALPLFPSQAPDFIGETVLTKFWELIHLLFVGIAVAYGLFSRRNVESVGGGVDLRMSRVDESSLSYVSRIFQVSSVFDDDELDEFESHSINVSAATQASVVVKERKSESESFVVEGEFEESSEVRAWNSQYFQGRSKVVVARPAYGLDGHVVHQPLGLPIRSLRSALRDSVALEDNINSFSDGTVNEKTESLVDDEVIAAAANPWPEMMGMGDNYLSNFQNLQPQSVDETQFGSLKSRSSRSSSSSSSQASLVSHTQNRHSPSRSVSEESLNSNVDESVKEEKSLQGSSSRSSSPSLPSSPSLSPTPPLPPSPKLVIYDDTNRRVLHSRHYSDGSLLEEDVRGRRTEFSSKKEPGSKSLKLTGESSRRRNKSRRSYPPESISSPPIGGSTDDSIIQRDNSTEKGLESELNNARARKRWSNESLEQTAEDIAKDEKFTESFPSLDVLFQPTNAKASRRAMRSSRGGEDVKRNSEDEDFDKKSRKKELLGNNKKKELKSNSLGSESQSWRVSSKVSSRGKSVRTIRGKELITNGESSDDRGEGKVEETRGRTKPRRQWKEELAIVPHVRAKSESEDEVVMEEEEPQVSLEVEEEEEAAWESQSNASNDHNEVDRKAGEFIAKFREQIRLQKLTSGEQPRGGGGGGSGVIRNRHFR